MIKIQVKNKASQQITNLTMFNTQEEVDAWIIQCESDKAFGMPEHQVMISNEIPELVDEETGEITQQSQEAVYETVLAEYEIIQSDATAEVQQEQLNNQSQQFLNSTDWMVTRHRDQVELGVVTSLNHSEFQALLQQRQEARDSIVRS